MKTKTWCISYSQNDWEYTGHIYIEASDITLINETTIEADGVKITFDEEIGDIKHKRIEGLPKQVP